jgi:nucleoid-associated protein YgaU
MAAVAEHIVKPDDRLDNLAQQYLGDPELFWQICDANRALRPADLTDDPPESGLPRVIRIGLPVGVPVPAQF